ncbi:MAG TPA: hypothetical protein VFK90_10275 [Anaeromyxobacter sp.]|nr:hypothetical protein [Anaeromyxobacter sp.]
MRRLVLLAVLVPTALVRADDKAPAPPAGDADPMMGWTPKKVLREAQDRREIAALIQAMDEAGKKGDLAAAAALVDFPVLMITDDSKGQASSVAWSREQWTQVMEPFYKQPMPGRVTHKPLVFLASDSLASLNDTVTMTIGKKSMTSRNTTLLVRKDGKWLVKAMMEGGWGDMMAGGAPAQQGASGSK